MLACTIRFNVVKVSCDSVVTTNIRAVVKMILRNKDWRQALCFCETKSDGSDTDDTGGDERCSIVQSCLGSQTSDTACKETTPFRELIKEMPGMAYIWHNCV